MTKRILALVLALLLPVAALAETYCLEWTVTMDAENAKDAIRDTGLFAGADDEDKVCQAFADMMDGIALRLVTQEDAGRLTLAFDETNLLDMSVIARGEDLVIASDLFSGKGFLIPGGMAEAEDDELTRLMENTDWMQLLGGMLNAAMTQLDRFEISTQRGSFSGDAYEGGVYCTTLTFDDADLAALLKAVMTDELRALVLNLARAMGFDGKAFLADLDKAHDDAASQNAYRYIIRLVTDADEQFVGASAVVLQGEKQLGTLSIGYADSELRIVVGFGLDDVNYWHCQGVRVKYNTDEQGAVSIQLDGAMEEFTAPKDEAFAYAVAVVDTPLMEIDWSAEIKLQGENATWSFDVKSSVYGAEQDSMTGKGFILQGKRFSNTSTSSRGGKTYMTERITWGPCDPIDTNTDGLVLCDITGDDAELMEEISSDLQNELVERLLQVIPMQLLLQLI